jgi:hypothetical protein
MGHVVYLGHPVAPTPIDVLAAELATALAAAKAVR